MNPAGTVPVYVEDADTEYQSLTLTQSGAILEYLFLEHRPDLFPTGRTKRALTQSTILAALTDIAVQNALLRYMSFDDRNVAFLSARLLTSIIAVFAGIRCNRYFGGVAPNIADYAHFPVVYMQEQFIRSSAGTSHIIDWLEQMKSDEAVQRSLAYAGLQIPWRPQSHV